MPTHIYQRPLMDQGSWSIPIRIVGSLPNYELGEEYEGRLQILNSVGPRTVKQIGGDRMPDGTSITIDEATAEVVVSWPALYKIPESRNEYEASLRNSDFESSKGWSYGVGWNISTENPITAAHSAMYSENKGESVTSHTSRYKVNQGRPITAVAKVRQGASAEGNAGASIMLEWRDEQGEVISRSEGNRVMSASKNRVYQSVVTAVPPENAYTVNIAFNGIRIRENKPVWLDDVKWDHVIIDVTEAFNPSDEYRLEIEVTDTTGRTARWSGSIFDNSLWLTSKPYPVYHLESVGIGSEFNKISHDYGLGPQSESSTLGGNFVSIQRRAIVKYMTAPVEGASLGGEFTSIARKVLVKYALGGVEGSTLGGNFISIVRKKHPLFPASESALIGAAFTSIKRSK